MKIDYTKIKSKISPYYPNPENIIDIGNKDNLFIFPITPTHLNWLDLIRYYLEKKIEKILNSKPNLSGDYSKMKLENKINLSFNKFKTHMKINSHRYWYLKKTFERSYKNVVHNNFDYKVIVIETHTKDFKKNLQDIDKFFKYIIKNYKNIEFVTSNVILSDYYKKKFVPLHINEK